MKERRRAHQVVVVEPGLDRHEWETEFQALQDSLQDSPAEALPELSALVERMLVERGYVVDGAVENGGIDPEVLTEYRAARETTARLERDEDVDPGDVAAAVNGLRAVYDHLLSERSAP